MQSAFAVTAAAAIAVTPFIGSASAAHADGANGEVRGYLWTGTVGSNWEGTYRMPDGSEAWCAQIWAPEPIHADEYGAETTLTLNNGAPLTAERMQQLAYIISEASDRVIDKTGKEADDYAAATSVIVHDWTNSGSQPYDPEWPLALFDAGDDPGGTGQQPNDVRDVYDLLIANAQQYSGAWTLDLDEVTAPDLTVGDEITVSGTLETASGNAIPDHEVHLAANGGALADETVTTDANGAFSTTITVEAASVSVDASRIAPASEVKMREPIAWDGGSRPQNMILVSDNVVSAEIEFDAKPQPVEPWIGTSATDQSDGDRVLSFKGGTIVDVVSYENLVPGEEYTLEGELMDQETGEGTGIVGEATFTPEEASGTVEVEFEVPAGFAGSTLVAFERLYDVTGELVAEHTDIEDEAQTVTVEEGPSIGTSATDQSDGDRVLSFKGGTIVDVVSYENLVPGQEYTLEGALMDQETGEGTGILGEATFTPEEASGTVEVEFDVPKGFGGSTLVVFEYLYDIEGDLVAEHTDIEDEAQTVTVGETPSIGTSATDQADGDRILPHDGGTIVDVVSYEHLTPGEEYTLQGELMDKETGEGTGILGETTFTPEEPSGTVEVEFTVPEGFAGSTLVAFEHLYDVTGDLVAEHTDIEDEAQTVTVEPKPAPSTTPEPSKPGEPGKPGPKPGNGGGLATTGGEMHFGLIAGALLLIGAGAGLAFFAKRRSA